MSDKQLLQRAWDALAIWKETYPEGWDADDERLLDDLLTRIAEPQREWQGREPEPVAWMYNGNLHEFDPSDWAEGEVIPLYTAPPPRQQRTYTLRKWVGLTDEDWIIGKRSADYIAGAEWAEAKLKEKNT